MITVMGQNFFQTELMACVFNGTNSTPATFVASTKVQCESPRMLLSGRGSMEQVSLELAFTEAHRYQTPQKFSVYGE